MKILLSAYACRPAPDPQSELGWHLVRQITRHHEVWVLTAAANRSSIEAELLRRPLPRAHVCYVDGLEWPRRWRLNGGPRSATGSHRWQMRAYAAARRLHREVGFDVAHHLGGRGYAAPGLLALLPMPLVWGPLTGGEPLPPSFRASFGRGAWICQRLRDVARRIAERNPLIGLSARRSAIVLAATRDTAARLAALGARRIELRGEAGLPAEQIDLLASLPLPPDRPVRFVSFDGRRHDEGLVLGLRAFAAAALPEAEYLIIADGRQRRRLQAVANEAGIASRVRFGDGRRGGPGPTGLREGHALVYPSLQDPDGWECLEAMAAGRPVICLERGAPTTQVTEQTGIRVPAATPAQIVRDLAAAMRRLALDPALRARMGDAGRARARRVYDWNAKGRSLVHLYDQIAGAPSRLIPAEPAPCAS